MRWKMQVVTFAKRQMSDKSGNRKTSVNTIQKDQNGLLLHLFSNHKLMNNVSA